MKPLEDIIREAAERGNLNYLSIAHTDRGWEVAYRGVDDRDRRLTAHADPVCAILEALTGKAPPAPERERRRRRRSAAVSKPDQDEIAFHVRGLNAAMPRKSKPDQFDDLLGCP